jgi:hypothetical protein
MQCKIGAFVLTVILSAALSGCLVEKKKLETITSTDTNLHIYTDGQYIDYTVIIDEEGQTQTGTLRVRWDSAQQIINPLDSTQYAVLKETTTLTIDDNSGNPNEIIRYIEQDSNGSMYVRAYGTLDPLDHSWLSDQPNVGPGILKRFEIFRSPLAIASSISLTNFYIFEDCDGANCPTKIAYYYGRSFEVVDSNQTVSTNAGTFANAYKISYEATVIPEPTAPLLDILDVCGGIGSITSHSAMLYVVPEIGIIEIVNICTDSGAAPVIYTMILDNTNITF